TIPLDIPREQQSVIAVAGLVAVLWFTETIPLFATAMIIPVLLVVNTGLPQKDVLHAFADPIIGLFFGSFVLAIALAKYGFDLRIAHLLSRLTKRSPRKLLFGVITIAALLGMWISNTATVSLLLPIIMLFVVAKRGRTKMPRFTKALLFGLATGAAVGGMATPVGTAPNALAVRYLADASISLSFVSWLTIGLPLVVLLVPTIWLTLITLFKPEIKRLPDVKHARQLWSTNEVLSLVIVVITIILWLTEPLHGITTPIIAVAAAFVIFASGLLKPADLAKLPFRALILFGGGIALGDAMVATGVTDSIVSWLFEIIGQQHPYVILLALILFAIAITTVASNTATAALLVPIVLSIALAAGVDPLPLVIGATLALSIDFISPVGTPPSTLIHATGFVHVRDFLYVGTFITVIAASLLFTVITLYFVL
ncbi:MAG: SLC13 family permease, partial [bacterium]|nr:SLC13 family permease [bacterium]